MNIQIKTKTNLISFLKENNIDVSEWGKQGHKSIDNLLAELQEEDCVIKTEAIREISIAVINIENKGKLLFEESQRMKNGFIRQRNKLPREKIKQNEEVIEAAHRCLKEEVNLQVEDFTIIKASKTPKVYIKESASYPNLKTRYLHYDIFVSTDKLPNENFTTKENGEEHDPVDIHYWTWITKNNIFEKYFETATDEIIILGTNSLFPYLEESSKFFFNKLILEEDLKLKIYYESDNENFNQSLTVDTKNSDNRTSFTTLQAHKDRIKGTTNTSGLKNDIVNRIGKPELQEKVAQRIKVQQINLRLPINVIKADNKVWYTFVSNKLPTISDYYLVENEQLLSHINSYIEHYTESQTGKVFLSNTGEELIQLYDRDIIPRGIFPRKSFYTTDFKRYSIWGFVFNRKGELLLHQRSQKTKDNRLLWDKSIGGYVDIQDSSTYQTAQRELIEELFLPEAEYTPFLKEDIGKFNNYGDLDFEKRPEVEFKSAFKRLNKNEWIMFRATDRKGNPLTVDRVSERRMIDDKNNITLKRTVFISDVYLFIAPPKYMDTPEQMKDLVKLSEKSGAAEDHKIISVDKLRDWIEEEESKQKASETFTDDLLYINLELRSLLERFSEFINYVF